ncbi:hypothetical protein [Thauera sp. SDU_THAU2]
MLLVVIPLFSLFQAMGLYDTYLGMIWVYQVVTAADDRLAQPLLW